MPRFPLASLPVRGMSDRVYTTLGDRAARSGRVVHPLHVGDTYLEPLEAARAEAQLTRDRPRLHNYAPVQGEPELRRAFVDRLEKRHGLALDADAVQVVPGATAGVSIAAQILVDPGDEVLVLAPFWPLSRGVVAARGGKAVEIPFFTRLDEPGFDVERELERHVTGRTVAIYVNSPNNPTGAMLTEDHVEAIARVAARHDLWVWVDEAYDELRYDGRDTKPVYLHPRLHDRALVFHTLSKSHGIAGSRIGFVHGPEAIMETFRGMQVYATYCAPRPLQFGAVRALREGDAWVASARLAYAEAAAAVASAIGVPAPRAGTFLFFDASPFLREGETTCAPFLERAADVGVLLTPGHVSGAAYARWARLCFTAVPPDALRAALDALRPVLTRS